MTIGLIMAGISLAGLAWQIYRDTKNHKNNEEKIGVIIEHLPEVAEEIEKIRKAKK